MNFNQFCRYTSLEGNRLQLKNDINLPVVFSLTHPLDEICPVLIKHGKYKFYIYIFYNYINFIILQFYKEYI